MIGQTFAPIGDPSQQRPSGSPSAPSGPQEAIKILNLRMPRVQGAGAPAPAALLNSPGSGGLPQPQGMTPMIEAILRAVMGGFQSPQQGAPSAMGGMVPGGGMPAQGGSPQLPVPAVHYQPPPTSGGTAGPNPGTRDRNLPMPGGKMNGFDYGR